MSDPDGPARLVLGPLLRYVGDTAATVWVQTSRPCQVEVLGQPGQAFTVSGQHYALVVIEGLQPGTEYPYQVVLDGTACWPEPGSPFPPSTLRTLGPGGPVRLAFGSCRVAELPEPQRRGARREPEHGPDALVACALDLRDVPRDEWPDALLLIGDQVYADEPGPATRQFIRERRDPATPPAGEVADFTEYCFLYHEAWSQPEVRWLLSVIPTAMIFDDHDVHDDWNISRAWRQEYEAQPWWHQRITSAYLSYWVYQHLGNLSPADLAADDLWREVRGSADATALLTDFARRADQRADGIQWTYRRDFGSVRVIVIDSRAGRLLDPGGRAMVDPDEWRWVIESVRGDFDHLVLASSLPLALPRGIHALEAWNEAVAGGAWGRRLIPLAERARRALDLEHWAAFGRSFSSFTQLLGQIAAGRHGSPPATVTVLGGDIHNSYLAPMKLPARIRPRSAVYQAVCSPLHNMLPESYRGVQRLAASRPGGLLAAGLARLAGVPRPAVRWRISHGPWFDNMLATLEYSGRRGRITFSRTAPGDTPHLEPVAEADLSS